MLEAPLKKKKKKKENRFCLGEERCIFLSYFGQRCIAPKRVIWRTCRFKTKVIGGNDAD